VDSFSFFLCWAAFFCQNQVAVVVGLIPLPHQLILL
jgi:hypothetical protein